MDQPMIKDTPRILVVDDEASIRDVISEFLQGSGFEVEAVSDGVAALERLRESLFDVALIDLEMPRMKGLELLERIRGKSGSMIPIMMTGYGTVETAIEALRNGAFDYLLKPFKLEEIVVLIRRALEVRHLEEENIQLKEMLSFYKISEASRTDMGLDPLLEMILDTMLNEIDADAVSLWFSDTEKNFRRLSYKASDPIWLGRLEKTLNIDPILESSRREEPILGRGKEVRDYFAGDEVGSVSSFLAVPVKIRSKITGFAFAYTTDPKRRFTEGQRKTLSLLANQAGAAVETARLYEDLKRAFSETIQGLCKALEAKDPYTRGHSERVSKYARMIAHAIRLPENEVEKIRQAALFHDIGKIGMKQETLNKPDTLTDEELEQFREHPLKSKQILEPIHFLKDIVPMVYHHHEWYNGEGYPDGLKGEEIPLGARIICIADSYGVMTEDRVYRKALTREAAVQELRRCSGTQFDPHLVEAFIEALLRFHHR